MKDNLKSKRKLKKSVKITGYAIATAITGITLITSLKHLGFSKEEVIIDDDKEENRLPVTIKEIRNSIENYYSCDDINSLYILKNVNDTSYIISNDSILDSQWQLIDNNDSFLQELADLDYDQFSSYWIKEQKLLVTVDANDNSNSSNWQEIGLTRKVPASVPNFVFVSDDTLWALTNQELIVDDKYNIFEFLQVYKSNDSKLFIGLELNLEDKENWEYMNSLLDFINNYKVDVVEPMKKNIK